MKNLFSDSYYLCGYIALVFITMRLPYVGIIIRVFNTLIHELAHALMAVLTSGKILKIELQKDTSGSTLSIAKNKRSQFLVAIIGYPASAGFSYLMFWGILQNYSLYILIGLLCISIVALMLFVRNSFGIFWMLIFISSIAFVIWLNNPMICDFLVASLAIILMIESVYAAVALFIIAIENPAESGDAKILNSITKIPALIWSLAFVLICGWVVYNIFIDFLIFK